VPPAARPSERQVLWAAAGDQVSVHHDLLVDERCAGVLDVLDDRLPTRHRASLQDVCRYEKLRCVADGKHRFAAVDELPDEIHGSIIGPELVGRISPWDEERIELIMGCLFH